jgi:hypothetical protein
MSCKHKDKTNCGCNGSPLTTSTSYTYGGENCPDGEQCEELYNAECITYTGTDITCGETVLWTSGERLTGFLTNFVDYFCTAITPYTIENVGSGAGVYQSQIGNTFYLRTITGDGITVEQLENEVRLTVTQEIDYISNIELDGTSLEFTGIGNAFSGSIELSSIIPSSINLYNSDGILTDALRTADLNSGILQWINGESNFIGETNDNTTFATQIKRLDNTQYTRFRNDGWVGLGGIYSNINQASPTEDLIIINGAERRFGFNGDPGNNAQFRIKSRGTGIAGTPNAYIFRVEPSATTSGFFVQESRTDALGNTWDVALGTSGSDNGVWQQVNWNGTSLVRYQIGGIATELKSLIVSAIDIWNDRAELSNVPVGLFEWIRRSGSNNGADQTTYPRIKFGADRVPVGSGITKETEIPSPYLFMASNDGNDGTGSGSEVATYKGSMKLSPFGNNWVCYTENVTDAPPVTNFGVGTNTPSAKLHLVGDLRIDDTLTGVLGSFAESITINVNGTDYKLALYNI